MGNDVNFSEITPKVWVDREFGVLPIFCYSEQKRIGDQIAIHFFEPRYLRLLRIINYPEKGPNCFIYACTGYPKTNTTAFVCSVNGLDGSDVRGTMTDIVKINQSWMDSGDKLWWCRFQVIKLNCIKPILHVKFSPNFQCHLQSSPSYTIGATYTNTPVITFTNNDRSTCNMFYDPEVKMYCIMCTPSTKEAIIKATTDKADPEYKSLMSLSDSIIWYLVPDLPGDFVHCRAVLNYVNKLSKELVSPMTRDDLMSLLVDLEVLAVNKIIVQDVKAQIEGREDVHQQSHLSSFFATVDFSITKGKFKLQNVFLTVSASKRIFRKISLKVNEQRLELLREGHVCKGCPLRRLPTSIIDKIATFLVYC